MTRKCYLVLVLLTMSFASRAQQNNPQGPGTGVNAGTSLRNGTGNSIDTIGDPSIFGLNEWKVYAWNSTNSDSWVLNYAGYYTDTALSMNTLNYWNDGASPSYAPNYLGDFVSEDDHSFSGKRQGFPFGFYSINIPGHDDYAYLLINGVEVWNHEGCCDDHYDVWQGVLTDTTTIEYRVMEFGGGSYGLIDLVELSLVASATSTFIPCYNGTSTVTISASGGFPPYSGTGTFTVSAGIYDYIVVDDMGDSTIVTVDIPNANAPDSVIATNASPSFCEGDTITLTGPAYGSALSFYGDWTRAVIPINSPETDYTYELDFKTTEPNGGLSSVRDGDLGGSFDRDLYLSNGQIYHRLWSEEIINSYGQNYADGQWHHVAVVVESGVGQRMYVDGILVATGLMDHSDFNWDNTINLGYGQGWFEGSIDNVRLWNVVRTPAEIIQDQTLQVNGSMPDLAGNWNFDVINGTSIINTVDNSVANVYDGANLTENNSNTYLWSNGETSRSITAAASGTFNVSVSTVNGCPVNTVPVELIMNTNPAVPIISTSSVLSFCSGENAVLNSSVAQGYQWNKNGVLIAQETSASITATESGNYSVTVTNSSGCSQTSAIETIEVFDTPSIPVISPLSSTTFCDGNSVDLTIQPGISDHRFASTVIAFSTEYDVYDWGVIQTLGAPDVYPNYGDIEYAWAPAEMDEPGEFLELGFDNPIPINFIDIYETYGPGSIDSVFVKNPGTGIFEPVYTAVPAYAGDTARMLHITFPMTSFSVSEIRITMDMSAVTDWNEIDAVAIGNDSPSHYLWSTGETSPIVNVSTTSTITLTITNALGCTSSSNPVEITRNSNPLVSAGPDMFSSECNSAYVLSAGNPTGGVYSGTGVNGGIFTPSIGTGTYPIEYFYMDANGCIGTSTAQMTVVPAPVVKLLPLANVCDDAIPFALSGGSPAGGTYSGTGTNNNTFDPSVGAGTYAIHYLYTDSLGCSQEAIQNLTVDICTGIASPETNSIASVYPNPAHTKVKVEFNSGTELYSLELYNATGSVVYAKELKDIKSITTHEIDLSQFPAGAYVLRANTKNGITNKKLMIE